MENNNFVKKVVDDMVESTRTVHQINKENIAVVKADSKANFEAATTPDPGFEKFKQAEGVGEKVKVVIENIKEGAKANSEKEKERREGIQKHEAYKTLLEEQRKNSRL